MKLLSQFGRFAGREGGIHYSCKECVNFQNRASYHRHSKKRLAQTNAWRERNRDKVRELDRRRAKERRRADPERHRANRLWRNYGITIEEYDELYEKQGGCCAICERHESEVNGNPIHLFHLHVDHDHVTGEVRGLLCRQCNMALAAFESQGCLDRAVEYLLQAA